ncbi:MAG: hypothetical protein ABH873_06745 [Candidatus Firestonebacteria bacterium]
MNLKHHKTLNSEKWMLFPFSKQIIMIANELNRAKNWINKNDLEEVKNCYERAFELIDLTISIKMRKNLLKELLRFRDVLAEQYISIFQKKDSLNSIKQKLPTLYCLLLMLNKDSYNLLYPAP